jgi:ATP-dependent Lon protease
MSKAATKLWSLCAASPALQQSIACAICANVSSKYAFPLGSVHLSVFSIIHGKSFILTRYVEKNNTKRENIYDLSKLLFENKIKEKYIVENFKEDIWKISDEYILEKMISIAEKWRSLDKIKITIDDFNKLLNFLYEINNKIFDEIKLLPSKKGEFNCLKYLKEEIDINQEIKEAEKKYINSEYESKILNNSIKIKNLNISKYSMNDLLSEINQFLNKEEINENKINLCKILINFTPNLESNDANDSIIKSHNDIRFIYSSVFYF